MTTMKVELFTALRGLKVSEQRAREVVQSLDEHIAMQINQATQPVLAKLESLDAKIEAQGSKLDSIRWFVAACITLAGMGVAVFLKLAT